MKTGGKKRRRNNPLVGFPDYGGGALAHNWTSKLDRRGESVLVPDAIKQQLNGCVPFTQRSVRTLSFNKNIIGREMKIAQGGTKFTSEWALVCKAALKFTGVSGLGVARVRTCTWMRLCMHMSVNKGGGGGSPVCAAKRFSTQHFSLMNYTFNQHARRWGEEEWTLPRCSSACNDEKIEAKAENNTEWTSSQGWKYKIWDQSVVKSPFSLSRPLSPPQDSITIHFINASLTLIMVSLNWSLWVLAHPLGRKQGTPLERYLFP